MNAIGIIFARGGSKGIPNKNIRLLSGKPLIAWSIEHALAIKRISRVIVSTDSLEIAEVARMYGAETPFIRPEEFATDDAPEWLAWQHAISEILKKDGNLPDAMVSIPTTAPLRITQDIERCIDEYAKGDVDGVIAVSIAHRNPWFNMVVKNSDGTVALVNKPMGGEVFRRQDAPIVYDMTTVAYVVNPLFVLSNSSLFSGRIRAIEIPQERSLDLDTLHDFDIANILINRN